MLERGRLRGCLGGSRLGSRPERWLALLEEPGASAGERAVDGVLVTISVSDLRSQVDADLEAFAGLLRARLDEALRTLGVILPVYVVVTMADLLPGFAEFWANDPKADDSAWGASFGREDDTAAIRN